jgi:hypothetical protein
MTRKALVNQSSGLVENVIEAGGDFVAPAGYTLITAETASPGDTWNGSLFTARAQTAEELRSEQVWVVYQRFLAAAESTKDNGSWGGMFHDLAVVLRWIEPD